MAAIGTIGQNFRGGRVEIWGTGCSPWRAPAPARLGPYAPPPDTDIRIHATRGPMSARLLSGGRPPDAPFGDPAALLPRFHAAPVAPRWELGVALHLSEVAERSFEATPRAELARYAPPGDGSVRLITMIAPPTVTALRDKIDEIRACRRIVSTSLHGYAIAAAYGVPCLYLGGDPGEDGLASADLRDPDTIGRVNARFVDLLLGYGETEIVYWRQHRRRPTDWDALIAAADAEARRLTLDEAALIAACPAGAAPLSPAPGGDIWDHPLVRRVPVNTLGLRARARAASRRFLRGADAS